ncbi:hypothetical protein FAZ19_22945 [Sphingobacterium alkalisoli]|uniref:Uncharacterized protein n=1 Tax=Sphingobacterium alkalisoli TaxID=1874115 RepID=A0A4U0GN04_9SPHI|nr:hypothetical protein [Sphingobacterium alkalisoli]TJY60113.1 hypothetical protein FAZ19_22945 [Sphingobacterium alkalisoli]GGH31991.1 hypothetical protein GCM10011418_45200 [Sphingobacterium alkalisoli]
MKKIIFVDSSPIGLFTFQTYILELCNFNVGFGIFIEIFDNPLILFEKDASDVVRLSIDESLVQYIATKSISSRTERLQYFNQLMEFVKSSEELASKMVFKEKKMEYLADSKYLVRMKNIYVNAGG